MHIKKEIRQHNDITQSRYEFTLLEQRIIYYLASNLNGMARKDIFDDTLISIPIAGIVKTEPGEYGSNNYKAVKEAAMKLYHRTFDLCHQNEKGKKVWTYVGIISGAEIVEGTGMLTVTVNKGIVPYLAELWNNPKVTSMGFQNALSLKSIYSQRFYAFICQYKDTGKWYVTLEQLHEKLKLDESSYTRWGNFKRNVLDVAEKELKEKADLYFTYKTRKTGKRITHLDFQILPREVTEQNRNIIYNASSNPLFQSLRKLKLSNKQALEVLKVVRDDDGITDLKQTIYKIKLAHSDGVVKNLGAYTWKVLNEKFSLTSVVA